MTRRRSPSFSLRVDLGNAAFDPPYGPELARILRTVADYVEDSDTPIDHGRAVLDINGNTCGEFVIAARRGA